MSGRASPQPPRPTRAKAAVLTRAALTRAAPGRCANANTQAPRPPRASLRRDETRLALTLLLATQVLLYGGFGLVAYISRLLHPVATAAAARALPLHLTLLGGVLLVLACLLVARATAGSGRPRVLLGLAALLGLGFLATRTLDPGLGCATGLLVDPCGRDAGLPAAERRFLVLHDAAMGLLAAQAAGGVALLAVLALRRLPPARAAAALAQGAPAWHLVAAAWAFLVPIFYLAR